ncbi:MULTISPECIES: hypothetical protein [unclassified Desulfovibrio]|uniref:hypothetical protein n=1 Tax=unclassified Desulfovibrio TaxID=2593640 RepID=UPI002FDAA234
MSLMGHCSYGGVREFKWIASSSSSSFGIDGMEEQNLSSEYEMLAFSRWKLCQFFQLPHFRLQKVANARINTAVGMQ